MAFVGPVTDPTPRSHAEPEVEGVEVHRLVVVLDLSRIVGYSSIGSSTVTHRLSSSTDLLS
jgi:hypothetical protein